MIISNVLNSLPHKVECIVKKVSMFRRSTTQEVIVQAIYFFSWQEIVQYSDAFAEEVAESEEAKDETVRNTNDENDAIEEAHEDKEISEEKVTDKGEAAAAQAIRTKGEEGEEMSLDEAAENLAIPVEPEKRAPNQRTETYYYYQCKWKLNLLL